MVGKSYLRYVVGPQGGCTVSNAALTLESSIIPSQYGGQGGPVRGGWVGRGGGGGAAHAHLPAHLRGRSTTTASGSAAAVLFVPSLEAVRVLSVRSGAVLHTLIPAEAKMPVEVTALRVFPITGVQADPHGAIQREGWMLLVGYSNGFVGIFSCSETTNYGKPVCRLYALGHKVDTNVLALATDAARAYACSAGQDTDITVWDVMGQEALYRLRGHRGGVVAMQFVPPRGSAAGGVVAAGGGPTRAGVAATSGSDTLLISAAADGLLKVWNLSLRQCIQTVVASDAQITSMTMDCEGRRLYCGVRESLIKVYSLDAPTTPTTAAGEDGGADSDVVLTSHGSLPRKYHKPITSFSFSPDWRLLLATTSRTVEVYRVLSSEDVKRRVYRRKRRTQRGKHGEASVHKDAGEDLRETAGEEAGEGAESVATQASGPRKKRGRSGAVGSPALGQEAGEHNEKESEDEALQTAAEEVTLLRTFFLTAQGSPNRKVRAACFVPALPRGGGAGVGATDEDALHIAVAFNNNTIQTYTTALTLSDAAGGATWTLQDLKPRISLDQQGHQTDIRALAFVENDSALLSLSREKLLLWTLTVKESNLESNHTDAHDFYDAQEANLARIDFKGTLNCYGCVLLNVGATGPKASRDTAQAASTSANTPPGAGDGVAMAAVSANLCCVGLSDGTVSLLDVASSETLFSDPAVHMGGVKAVTKRPDDSGFLTVGADRRLVVWTVGLLKDNRSATLVLATELELTELPLFASFSPDNHYLGVGLQNNNIQLFFADSLKPYLSLFGHKLPPTAIAFSDDGTLAASVGTDKSLRFWGTDFGDCHRAIHAHDDYITAVSFVAGTHYVFTVSLDGSVKQWDGDNWTMIQFMRQHQHGLWAVAITRNATCVATAGADKCIRCFLRTQDIVFPEEEEERMGQEAMDEEAARRAAMQRLDAAGDHATGAALLEVGVAGQQTAATAEAAERIMAALDLVSVELQRRSNPEDLSPRHPLLATMTEWEYLWSVIASVRPSELRHALAALTAVHVDALLGFLEKMVEARAVLDYEIAAKLVLGLVMPSTAAAAAGAGGAALALRTTAIRGDAEESGGVRRLEHLRRAISDGLDRSVARMDYNIAGLQFVRQYLQDAERVKFFDLSKIQGHKKKYHSRTLPTAKKES